MLNTKPKFLSELLPLLPRPLHLAIVGEPRSEKTLLAQLLAKELEVDCEIWSSPPLFCLLPCPQYPLLLNAPIYTSNITVRDGGKNWVDKEFFKVWQQRANYWQKNDCSNLCIVINELMPNFMQYAPRNHFTDFFTSRSGRSASIIITTQGFEFDKTSRYFLQKLSRLERLKQMWLDTYKQRIFNNINSYFLTIRLGREAERFAERVLQDRNILWQIKSAKYPCLVKDKVIDLIY